MLYLSIHVAKVAGTSFATLLESLPVDAVYWDYGKGHRFTHMRLTPKRRREDIVGTEERIVSGEPLIKDLIVHGHFFATKYLDTEMPRCWLTWVREPIERLFSHYEFWKNYKFPAYEEWRKFDSEKPTFLEFATTPQFVNAQSRSLVPLTVDDFDFIGILEKYEESIQHLADLFEVDRSTLPAVRHNVTKDKETLNLSATARKKIEEANSVDYALYRAACRRHTSLNS